MISSEGIKTDQSGMRNLKDIARLQLVVGGSQPNGAYLTKSVEFQWIPEKPRNVLKHEMLIQYANKSIIMKIC